jgi:hypothetical protein
MTPLAVPPARQGFVARAVDAARYMITGVTPATFFGPLQPLPPMAPPEVKGRQWDYPTGVNLQYTPRGTEPIGFWQLRELAYSYPLLRSVIETRKDQIASLEYMIKPKDGARKGKTKVKAVDDPASKRVTEFLLRPDRENDFASWLRMLIEELLVTDAATIYPRRTRGGDIYSFDLIDGATIKPLIGEDGRRPLPPDPAYQQILKGIPAADFSADELIYAPRNKRVHSLGYGYSPVEQIVLTVNIALRREVYTLDYYKTGSIPDAFGTLPKEWTPDQIRGFQDYFNSFMEGDLERRRQLKFMPSDFKLIEARQPPLKDAYDEWLARVVCYAFSVPISPFVNQVNRATGETLKLQATQEGMQPLKLWLKNILDRMINVYMNEPSVEFAFNDEDENDPLEQAQTLQVLVSAGIKNRDEARDDLGLEAIPGGDGEEYNVTLGGGLAAITIPEEPEPDPNAPVPPQLGPDGKPVSAASVAEGKGKTAPKNAPVNPKLNADKMHAVERLPFTKAAGRRPGPVPFDRPAVAKAVKKYTKAITAALDATRASVVKQLKDAPLGKAADDDTPPDDPEEREAWAEKKAQEIADDLDLSALASIADDETLPDLALDTVQKAVAKLGVSDREELVNQVNDAAVAIARDRAAELVGKSIDEDGNIIDNPDAEWAITDSTRDMIRDAIADGLADNIGRDDIISNIEDMTGFSENRAEMIAETEIARVNSLAALESYKGAASIGVKVKKEWLIASSDVCDECLDNADAGPIDLDDAFPSGDDAPPAHPECLPGDALVLAAGISGATKRRYDGDLVIIGTASGKQLRCTPNHPVLTSRGWLAAGLLDECGDVVSSGGDEWEAGVDLDADDVPARIEDVAEAFGRSEQVASVPVPTTPEDFHGDGEGSKVAVVWTNRLLVRAAYSALRKETRKLAFGIDDMSATGHDGAGVLDLLAKRLLAATHGGMRSGCDGGELLSAERGHAKRIGFGLPADANSGFDQSAPDTVAVDAKTLRKGFLGQAGHVKIDNLSDGEVDLAGPCFDACGGERPEDHSARDAGLSGDLRDAHAADVFLDTIVSARRVRFSGHVYNLQTTRGFYVACGIVVHNCRCALSPVVEDDEEPDEGDGGNEGEEA